MNLRPQQQANNINRGLRSFLDPSGNLELMRNRTPPYPPFGGPIELLFQEEGGIKQIRLSSTCKTTSVSVVSRESSLCSYCTAALIKLSSLGVHWSATCRVCPAERRPSEPPDINKRVRIKATSVQNHNAAVFREKPFINHRAAVGREWINFPG